jgi:hypothetical protein
MAISVWPWVLKCSGKTTHSGEENTPQTVWRKDLTPLRQRLNRQHRQTVLVVLILNRLAPSFLSGHAEIIGLGTAVAWQNTMAVCNEP